MSRPLTPFDIPTRSGNGTHPGRDAVVSHLDELLAESLADLESCLRQGMMQPHVRDQVKGLARQVDALRSRLADLGPCPLGQDADRGMVSVTRAMIGDVERVGLFAAFRERCAGLPGRLADEDRAGAAVSELWAGLRVLSRHVRTHSHAA